MIGAPLERRLAAQATGLKECCVCHKGPVKNNPAITYDAAIMLWRVNDGGKPLYACVPHYRDLIGQWPQLTSGS